MGVRVWRSNRLEALADRLAEEVERWRLPPVQPRKIVVQGGGLDHWLALRLASRLGVWGHAEFPFPRKYFEELFAAAGLPPREEVDPYAPLHLTWAVAAELSDLLREPEFQPVRDYLGKAAMGQAADRDVFSPSYVALCHRLAMVLDHYLVYRPQWIHAWEAGLNPVKAGAATSDNWQAMLWRRVARRLGPCHFTARAKQWVDLLASGALTGRLPERTVLFGIAHLPPLFVELLAQLAAYSEVHLFLVSPSPEYWASLRSRRQFWRFERERAGALLEDESRVAETEGNPLLATFGRVGREFQAILESVLDYEDADAYVRPGDDSALHVLQGDMFDVAQRPSAGRAPVPLDRRDFSVRVHACHSPLRELEVLRDQIRALLECDLSLQPEDILVLCPDMETYTPLIEAVFGSDRDDPTHIPYSIADQPLRAADETIAAFLLATELAVSRFSTSELFNLLSATPVRRRFGISTLDLDRARQWWNDAGIRWGIDGAHRHQFGYPEIDEYSWQFGLRRFLLGAAMPPDPTLLFRGVSPYPEVEGSGALFAGKLAELVELLVAWRKDAAQPKDIAAWASRLRRLQAELLCDEDRFAFSYAKVRRAIDAMERGAQLAEFQGLVPLEALLPILAASLDEPASAFGFLRGGVTFCGLHISRCVPARVVCMVGMNDGDFPRVEAVFPLNRASARRHAGDPSRREEDRYLFLQALLSAHDCFLLTYVGYDIRNNSERPPAVVVEELLDVCDRTFLPPDGVRCAREILVVRHPLQPFSPRYFTTGSDHAETPATPGGLVSFSPAHAKAAERLIGHREPSRGVVRSLLETPFRSGEKVVDVETLATWLENAPIGFLRQRLGAQLRADVASWQEELPIDVDELERWALGQQLLEMRAARQDQPEEAFCVAARNILRAMGRLPAGRLEENAFRDTWMLARPLAELIRDYARGERLEPWSLDIEIGGWRLVGVLRHVWPQGQVRWTFSLLRPTHVVNTWVWHLAFCLAKPPVKPDVPRNTFLIGRDKASVTGPMGRVIEFPDAREDARERLAELMRWYELGLSYPLPFVADASWKFWATLESTKNAARAREDASYELQGGWRKRIPEHVASGYQLLYRTSVPTVDDLEGGLPKGVPDFHTLAREILRPLRELLRNPDF